MTRYQCNQCTWRLINSPRGARKKKKSDASFASRGRYKIARITI